MKKNLQSMPSILGISAAVLVVVTALAVATDECNKYVRSGNQTIESFCRSALPPNDDTVSCSEQFPGQPCYQRQIALQSITFPAGGHYFSRTLTEEATNHSVVMGYVVCGYVYNCRLSFAGVCFPSKRALDSNGKPIPRRYPYYDNADCYVGA